MIAFGAPWALLGLVAAAIPVLLHLVQRREPPEVAFPAVRYLEDATRDHRRRIKLRNLLLLIVRTLLIILIVLAAARPVLSRGSVGEHVPSALVIVLDNSASSAAIADGVPVLDRLVAAARDVLDRATPADRLWLLTADGLPRPGTPDVLREALSHLRTEPVRTDLGDLVRAGADLVRGAGRPGEVVVITDGQRSAISAVPRAVPILVLAPDAAAPPNRAVASLDAIALPWGAEGGRLALGVQSSDTTPVPVTVAIPGRPAREVLTVPGVPASLRVTAQSPGWAVVSASLPPDEFRLDDQRTVPVRVAPPTAVRWDPADRWISTAMQVLQADGRVRTGDDVRIGAIGQGPAVVLPPADPARVGAINRALQARGVPWRFGPLVVGDARTDSSELLPAGETMMRRHRLEAAGVGGDTLVTVNGEPWAVRSGEVLVVASRLEPEWTALPVSAAFVPFLDRILTRAAVGAPVTPTVHAGEAIALPERATAVASDTARWAVEGGAPWKPRTLGVHYLVAGADTLGAVAVHLDARESALERAPPSAIRDLWPGARVEGLDDGARYAFTAGGRGDLRGVLLMLAALLVLAETILAGRVTRRS